MKLISLLAVVALVAACDRSEQAATPTSAPATTESQTGALAAEETADPTTTADEPIEPREPIFRAMSHPWAEEFHQLEITFVTEAEVEFRAKPDEASEVVARKTYKKGAKLDFDEAQTVVWKPFVTKATRVVEVGGTTEDGTRVTKKLAPGDSFETLIYAGEGTCAIRLDGRNLYGTCPNSEQFQAAGWSGKAPVPEEFDLWVRHKKGWALVDLEAVETKPVSTL